MKAQQTLVLIKPDGLVKSLTGNIITELSDTGLKSNEEKFHVESIKQPMVIA